MISFRFHLVSIVAVFLALGVGVLTGTTVINQRVVGRLESQTSGLSNQLDTLREQFDELQAEADVWNAYGEQTFGPLLAGRLTQQQVVILTEDGTSEESLAGARRALEAAGGQIVASLSVSSRMALTSEADRSGLATILGMDPATDPEALTAQAAEVVGDRLVDGPNGTDDLELLLESDYLVVQGAALTDTGLRALGGPQQAIVAIAGGPAPSDLDPALFLVPLIRDLAVAGMPVAAAEPAVVGEQEPPFVTLLRDEADIAPVIATQDNVDQLPGQLGLAVALQGLLLGDPGHFGIKDGASQVLPDLT